MFRLVCLLFFSVSSWAGEVRIDAEGLYKVHEGESRQVAEQKARQRLHQALLENSIQHIQDMPDYSLTLNKSGLYKKPEAVRAALQQLLKPQIIPREDGQFWSGKSYWLQGSTLVDDTATLKQLWQKLDTAQSEPDNGQSGNAGSSSPLSWFMEQAGIEASPADRFPGAGFSRARKTSLISQAIAGTMALKMAMSEHFYSNGEYPSTLYEIGYSADSFSSNPTVGSVATNGYGTIIIELAGSLEGHRIVWEPREGGQGWDCHLSVPATETMKVGSCQQD